MNSISATEMLSMVAHQWANTKDIMRIGAVGKNKAISIRKKIEKQLIDSDKEYALPNNKVPMKEVVKYFKIDIDYLSKLTKKGIINNE